MEVIKLFGTGNCHKTKFYKQWLENNNIPFDFYDVENNEMNMDFLSFYYADGQKHYPTLVIGNKTLRNPSIRAIQKQTLITSLAQLDNGYSEVFFKRQRYAVTKESFNDEKSFKVYAKNLKNGDFISFNLYLTKAGTQLKPCEIPEAKVLSFLKEYENINNELVIKN